MLIFAEKLIAIKIFQIVISAQIDAFTQDYKPEVPNVNIRFWQTPLREAVYQSIARHRVYRGENLDERQEYDRMLWGKIRVARFMKRLDVAEANEGLRTGVLVNGKRGDYEFRQTDHSIYDCVGRKCRSDNVLLAVWRVQQMNEPYTLYVSVKVPNYLYHFEPTEDIYLFTVEKGLKRLRYQQNSLKKLQGKLIYDPYPFVSSRFTTHSTPEYPTIPAVFTTAVAITTPEISPTIKTEPDTYENTEDQQSKNTQDFDQKTQSQTKIGSGNDELPEYTLEYFQNPLELTTAAPLTTDPDQALIDSHKGSGIRRTFNVFYDTNPYWQLDLISPPSQYKNYSDIQKPNSDTNYDISRDTIFTSNQPKEVIITPKPFKPSAQFFTYSEPDPFYQDVENTSKSLKYTSEHPVIILSSSPETQTDPTKLPEILPFRVEDAKVSFPKNNEKKSTTRGPKVFKSRGTTYRNRLTGQRGNPSTHKTKTHVKKGARVKTNKVRQEKNSDTADPQDAKSSASSNSFEPQLMDRYLSPTTYHPKLNFLLPSESRQFYSHLSPSGADTTSEQRDTERSEKARIPQYKTGKIQKRQESEGYFSNGYQESEQIVSTDTYGTYSPWPQYSDEYQTTPSGFSADYDNYNGHYSENTAAYGLDTGGDVNSYGTPSQDDTEPLSADYSNSTQELQEYYTTDNSGNNAAAFTTPYFTDYYTQAVTENTNAENFETKRETINEHGQQFADDSTNAMQESLRRNYSRKISEEADKHSTVKPSVDNDTNLQAVTATTEKTVVQSETERTRDKFESADTHDVKTDCASCLKQKSVSNGKNYTISVIVSRLTKSITQRMQNGTEAVRKRNAPIYRKKVLKKLKTSSR